MWLECKGLTFPGRAPMATLFILMLLLVPSPMVVAQEKVVSRSVESEALQTWFIDKLCSSIQRGRTTGKGFRNEAYLIRYCGDDKPPPPQLTPKMIIAKFPDDSNYPVAPGLLACDVASGESNTCDTFADVCLSGLNGTGWCEANEGGGGTCWCEYDPDIN